MIRTALAAGFLFLAATPAGAQASSCALPSAVDVDRRSFADAGYDSGRLSEIAAAAQRSLADAVDRLCASGAIRPTDLEGYSRLVVQNGPRAAEPVLRGAGRETLVFRYAFGDGAHPSDAAVVQAVRCFRKPHGFGCYGG